jgi:MYXO-CTERM domain-containing protein
MPVLDDLHLVAEKGVRNAYDRVAADVRTSENIALWWNLEERAVDEAFSTRALDALEKAWDVYFEVLGLPSIDGTARNRFNVYVGGTMLGWPATLDGALGYHSGDPDGVPYLVLNPDALADLAASEPAPGFFEWTLHHELFHASHGNDVWRDGAQSWLKEAGAEWGASQVNPDNPWRWYAPAFALLRPQLPIHANEGVPDAPDASLDLWHEYGMSRYADTLVEALGVPWFVGFWNDATTLPRQTGSWEALDAAVAASGADAATLFHAMAVRNARVDATYDPELDAMVARLLEAFDDSVTPTRVALRVPTGGLPTPTRPPDASLPGAMAYNHTVWSRPEGAWAEVRFLGDAESSLGRPSRWAASAVVRGGAHEATVALAVDGTPTAFPILGAERVTLVVSSLTPPQDVQVAEHFGYAWTIVPVEAPATGCGCRSGPTPGIAGAWLGGLALTFVVRRRRCPVA